MYSPCNSLAAERIQLSSVLRVGDCAWPQPAPGLPPDSDFAIVPNANMSEGPGECSSLYFLGALESRCENRHFHRPSCWHSQVRWQCPIQHLWHPSSFPQVTCRSLTRPPRHSLSYARCPVAAALYLETSDFVKTISGIVYHFYKVFGYLGTLSLKRVTYLSLGLFFKQPFALNLLSLYILIK